MRFNGSSMTLDTAAAGLGVAIARRTLVAEELISGRLVQALPGEIASRWSHYTLTMPELADWPPLKAS